MFIRNGTDHHEQISIRAVPELVFFIAKDQRKCSCHELMFFPLRIYKKSLTADHVIQMLKIMCMIGGISAGFYCKHAKTEGWRSVNP